MLNVGCFEIFFAEKKFQIIHQFKALRDEWSVPTAIQNVIAMKEKKKQIWPASNMTKVFQFTER